MKYFINYKMHKAQHTGVIKFSATSHAEACKRTVATMKSFARSGNSIVDVELFVSVELEGSKPYWSSVSLTSAIQASIAENLASLSATKLAKAGLDLLKKKLDSKELPYDQD